MDRVPVVNIAAPSATSLAALDAACRDHGFFLLEGHGLNDLVDRTWDATRRFFSAGPGVKEPIRRTADRALGWYDRELTKRTRDHKEVFDFIDPDLVLDSPMNRWPDGLDGFEDTMRDFFDAFAVLADRTTGLVHETLGLDPETIEACAGARSTSTVRLNHYTVGDPVPEAERAGLNELGPTALGAHTDPGVLTLLLQDDCGGLQTQTRDGAWLDVEPRPGTVVVNLGDTTQVRTNDRYRAAVHRVVPMTDSDRYSIPLFFNPRRDAVVEPIGSLVNGAPAFHPFTWREFIAGRAEDNYADLGVDDIQIDRFRVA
jgi:isopenicillin N synthase-like dioxygenase|tara:strand:- start:144 stop:1088 length:945 start_codon:yes stop_codon:yes gene_type:complete